MACALHLTAARAAIAEPAPPKIGEAINASLLPKKGDSVVVTTKTEVLPKKVEALPTKAAVALPPPAAAPTLPPTEPKAPPVTVAQTQTQTQTEVKVAPPPAPKALARVITSPAGAQVVLDGVLIGQAPLVLPDSAPGQHVLEVKLSGFLPYRQIVELDGTTSRVFSVELKPVPPPPVVPSAALDVRGFNSFGGRAVRRGAFTADVSLGYPYLLELRLTAGAWERGMGAFDGGVQVRTFGQVTDIALMGRLQFFNDGPLYLGFFTTFGGGGGPNGRNTFFADLGPGVTLAFKDTVSFNARAWLGLYSDRMCPSRDDTGSQPRADCLKAVQIGAGNPYDPRGDRDGGARFHLGAWIDVSVWAHVSIFAGLYGVPFGGERIMFRGDYNPVLGSSDTKIYGQLGLSFKE